MTTLSKGLGLHLLTITLWSKKLPIFGGRNREKEVDLSRLVFWKRAGNWGGVGGGWVESQKAREADNNRGDYKTQILRILINIFSTVKERILLG